MKKFAAKVTSKGRITIDVDVREELDLEEGDFVLAGVKPIDSDESAEWMLG